MPPGCVDTENRLTHALEQGGWHQDQNSSGLAPLNRQAGNMYSKTAKNIRDR